IQHCKMGRQFVVARRYGNTRKPGDYACCVRNEFVCGWQLHYCGRSDRLQRRCMEREFLGAVGSGGKRERRGTRRLGHESHRPPLAWSGTNLIRAGSFSAAGGAPASRIAKWNGNSWSAFGSGLDNNVNANAMATTGNAVYLGGNFTIAGGKVSAFAAGAILDA